MKPTMITSAILACTLFTATAQNQDYNQRSLRLPILTGRWCEYGYSTHREQLKTKSAINWQFANDGTVHYQNSSSGKAIDTRYQQDGGQLTTSNKTTGNYQLVELELSQLVMIKKKRYYFWRRGSCL